MKTIVSFLHLSIVMRKTVMAFELLYGVGRAKAISLKI